MKKMILTAAIATVLSVSPMLAQATGPPQDPLEKQIRHELVMLPFYGVFDNFQFRVEGDKVVLLGEVNRPTLKTSAERVVKRIPGVGEVENQIRVLPLSRFDDRIRLATYRTLYGNNVLWRYAHRSIPTIHIIVDNGNVTLEGAVGNEMDKNMATILANQVSGAFSVTNNLLVDRTS